MKRWFFVLLAVLSIGVVTAFAAVRIVIDEVLPNTSDDTNLEYIEIGNIDCLEINLSGYVLRDASEKTYLLSWTIASGARKKVLRPESKIILNNTDERIDLLDDSGVLIDQFSYTTSTKDIVLSTGHFVLPVCPPLMIDPPVIELNPTTNTGGINATQTGSTQTWPTQTGTIDTNTGGIIFDPLLPVASTGSQNSDTSSGSTISTGATLTGLTSTGTSSSGAIPETPINNTGIILANTGGTTGYTWSTSTWSISESWGIPSQASNIGSTATWSTGSWNTFTGATFTGELDPDRLFLYDQDGNGKIDLLQLRYPFDLTGSLDTSKLVVYSTTGGLSDVRIESSTWVIRSLSHSGNLLIVELIEWNIEHLDLKINTTTSSDLRLKTYTGFWLQTLDGRMVNPITYTKSFYAYSGAYIENTAYMPPPVVPTSSWGGNLLYTTEHIIIYGRSLSDPKITVQSGLTPENICKSVPCRVNFIATPKFKYEKCNWVFDGANVENKNLTTCNPSQIEFQPGNHRVTLYFFEEWNPTNMISSSVMIYEKATDVTVMNSTESALPKEKLTKKSVKSSTLPGLAEVFITPTVELLYGQISDALLPLVAGDTTNTLVKKSVKKPSTKAIIPKKITKAPAKIPKKTAVKKASKPKKVTVKKPKVLAVKKTPAKAKVSKTTPEPVLKNPQNSQENTLSPIARAAAAGSLACIAWMGGYFIGRRRKISCSDTVVS